MTKKKYRKPPYFNSYFIKLITDFNRQDVSIEQLSRVCEKQCVCETLYISFDVKLMIIQKKNDDIPGETLNIGF